MESSSSSAAALQDLEAQVKELFYKDLISEANAVISRVKELAQSGKLLDKENAGQALALDSEKVKQFMELEEVKHILKDEEMVHYFMEETANLGSGKWTVHKDEPLKKVFYILEEGEGLITMYGETYVDAPVQDVLSLLIEVEQLPTIFPEITVAKQLKEVTENRGLFYVIQSMPWPIWPRDNVSGSTVRYEAKHNAVMLCSSSLEDGQKTYFGEPVPPIPDGHVRAQSKREVHFVQRIDEKKTKYAFMFNTDLKFDKMPNMVMNWLLKMICAQLIDGIKEKAETYDKLGLREKRKISKEFYENLEQKLKGEAQ